MANEFEKDMAMIEKIVNEIESGDIKLDALLEKYQKGMELIRKCKVKLNEIEVSMEEVCDEVK